MKKIKKFLFSISMACLPFLCMAQLPVVTNFDIDKWSLQSNDSDFVFNRSTVPLQPRFKDLTVKANANQYYDGQVAACVQVNENAITTPSQGVTNRFDAYSPTYWQYLDVLICWQGGLPPAPLIDIAHLNGTKVLGLIMFGWNADPAPALKMLTKVGSEFIYAKKAYEAAKYFGFDGYFLNDESYRGPEWKDWIAAFNSYAVAGGTPNMEIQYYDNARTIVDKNAIISQNNLSYMLDYGCVSAGNISTQKSTMTAWGFSTEQYFKKVYFGIDQSAAGFTANGSLFKTLFTTTGHTGSIALFRQDEYIAKLVLATATASSGQPAYDVQKTVFANESRFWTNAAADPTDVSGWNSTTWPGFANAMMERSTIQSKPFMTSFSNGLGKYRYIKGEKLFTGDWSHLGMQDLLPTWRWWIDCPKTAGVKDVKVDYDWDVVYNVGTSLKVTGKLTAAQDHLIRLYKTKLPIVTSDKFRLVYQTTAGVSLELKAGVSENSNAFTTFALTQTTTSNGWTIAEVDLSSLNGKTISIIALNLKGSLASFTTNLGELGIFGTSDNAILAAPTNLKSQKPLLQSGNIIRLQWDAVAGNVEHYNVFVVKNGIKTLAGQTRSTAFPVVGYDKTLETETSMQLSVVAVSKALIAGSEASITLSFPASGLPSGKLKYSKTFITVGETVDVEALIDNYPQTYTWVTPQGATLVSSNGNKATFRFDNIGSYDIEVAATNSKGTASIKEVKAVLVTTTQVLQNVTAHKSIIAFSSEYLYNGVSHPVVCLTDGLVPPTPCNKWCTQGANNFATIDLGNPYKLYRFNFYDCKLVEPVQANVLNYDIWVSIDNVIWTRVVQGVNRPENTKTDYIAPVIARYVKFCPIDTDIRIWEFQAWGLDVLDLEETADKNLTIQSYPQQFSWGLGGLTKESNFGITVTSGNTAVVAISNVVVDAVNQNVKFNTDVKSIGSSLITVALTNGTLVKTSKFTITGIDPTIINLALNKTAVVVTGGSGQDPDTNANNKGVVGITDGNPTTYWFSMYDNANAFQNTFTIGLGGVATISKAVLRFAPNVASLNNLPGDIQIQTGNSATGPFTTVATILQANVAYVNEVSVSQSASFMRAVIKPYNQYGFALAEFEIYGKFSTAVPMVINDTRYSVWTNQRTLHVQNAVKSQISVYNALGMKVQETTATSDHQTLEIGISGVFMVIVQKDGFASSYKVVAN